MKKRSIVSVARVKRLLHNLPIFEMLPDRALDRLIRSGKLESLDPDQTLFEIGDPADRFHVILEGAVEILREQPGRPGFAPTAYLTPGEVIGGLSLLTGTPRRCVGRVPESLVVWTISRGPFETFARSTPGYWHAFSRALARRLEALVIDESGLGGPKDLSGRLEHFDLPTVVQTLVSSRQTGILALVDDDGQSYAEVLLVDGEVERARCDERDGEDAFIAILLAESGGQFHFRTVADPKPDSVGRSPIVPATMNLLMDAARQADESRADEIRNPGQDRPEAEDVSSSP